MKQICLMRYSMTFLIQLPFIINSLGRIMRQHLNVNHLLMLNGEIIYGKLYRPNTYNAYFFENRYYMSFNVAIINSLPQTKSGSHSWRFCGRFSFSDRCEWVLSKRNVFLKEHIYKLFHSFSYIRQEEKTGRKIASVSRGRLYKTLNHFFNHYFVVK